VALVRTDVWTEHTGDIFLQNIGSYKSHIPEDGILHRTFFIESNNMGYDFTCEVGAPSMEIINELYLKFIVVNNHKFTYTPHIKYCKSAVMDM
jgi:hypothetical protein